MYNIDYIIKTQCAYQGSLKKKSYILNINREKYIKRFNMVQSIAYKEN